MVGRVTYVRLEPHLTRLGNWMFQYAAAKCAAPEEPVAFVMDDSSRMDEPSNYAELWPDAMYVGEAPKGAIVREGLFQDVALLDEKIVRGVLGWGELRGEEVASKGAASEATWKSLPLGRVRAHLIERYGEIFRGKTVGVSVRRGDYLKLPHEHPFVGKAYLRKAVETFPAESTYVVCSDDIPWCKKFFAGKRFGGRRFVFVENEEVLSQLFIHTMCEHNIISNSTFSWWGAYLNPNPNKRVIFPSLWLGMAIQGDGRELYWKGCEVIENRYSFGMRIHALLCMVKNRCGKVVRGWGKRLKS